MSSSRHLAAILFADVVGYTAMMQEDELLALNKLHRFKEELESRVKERGGKIIQFYGDGCLFIFPNSADAVGCAKILQENYRKDPPLPVRIGIHLGDFVWEEGNIFGDSINISSRIESMGIPGSILLSDLIKKQIQNKPEFQLTSLGEFEFKNVDEPMEIFALSNIGFPVPSKTALLGKFKEPEIGKSIAVLPFVNMSNDTDQEYFSDGISEEIYNSLAHVKGLKVAGRTSSFQFKGKNTDLREVGEKLNVGTILEGSVRKQGNRLRITAQLINVKDGYHLWSEQYDRELNDVFVIQEEIALAITEKLKVTLLQKEKALISKNPTENHEAYDLYLKGRYHLNRRGSDMIKALEYFKQATELDPSFALAFTGMADAYAIIAFYGIMPPHEVMPKAKKFAEKAIQLNAALVEAYTSMAFISVFYDWNWKEAKKYFQHTFDLNPNYGLAHYWYSYYLSFIERNFELSIKEARIAAENLDPLVAISHHVLSMMYINAGKFEEGLEESKLAIELDENSFPAYRGLGISLAKLKKYKKSIDALKKAVRLSARHPWPMVELCWVYSLSGKLPETQEIFDELTERSKTEYISGLFMAGAAYFSKNFDKAFEFMEIAFSQRDGSLPCIKTWPLCAFIREDPRFQPFLTRMNFLE